MGEFSRTYRHSLGCSAAIVCMALASPAVAQTRSFDVPAQDASSAIPTFAKQAGVQVLASANDVRGKRTRAVRGNFSVQDGLRQLLEGSGLEVAPDSGTGIITIRVRSAGGNVASTGETALAGDASSEDGPSADIVVTGTRIQGQRPTGSQVIVVSAADIENSGRSNVADALRMLPQNSGEGPYQTNTVSSNGFSSTANFGLGVGLNLRGIGPTYTLTLLNGRRLAAAGQGAYVDISQIPTAGIERVEIVPDGSSAIYGSDAIAGVVNIVLNRKFEGTEIGLRGGVGSGFREARGTFASGRTWSSGSAFLSLQYLYRSPLAAEDRDFATDDLTGSGGTDLRRNNSNPGTISAGGRTYAIPANQNGIGLTATQLIAGTANKQNRYLGAYIYPKQEQVSGVLSVSQEIGDSVTASIDILASHRHFENRDIASTASLTVPRSNPFFVSPIANAQTVTVLYNFLDDLGPVTTRGSETNATVSSQLKINLGTETRLTPYFVYSLDHISRINRNVPNTALLAAALADTNPNTAFNPFGDGSFTNPVTLAAIRGYALDLRARSGSLSTGIDLSGPLFTLGGNVVRYAVGGEYRRESYFQGATNFTSTASPVAVSAIDASRIIKAIYGEVQFPFGRLLSISVAGRAEWYSDFGSTQTPKIGIEFQPLANLRLRGSWGKSFHAPLLPQLHGNTAYTTLLLPSPNGGTAPVIAQTGSNPNLRSENADTWSVGLDAEPFGNSGPRLSLTYYSVDFSNQVQQASSSEFSRYLTQASAFTPVVALSPSATTVADIYADPGFSATSVKYPAAQIAAIVDLRQANAGRVLQSGLDLSLIQSFKLKDNSFNVGVNINRITKYKIKRFSSSSLTSYLAQIGNPQKVRGRASLGWQRGPLALSIAANYIGSYTSSLITPAQEVSAWSTFDARLGYSLSVGSERRNLDVALDIRNLTDKAPPRVANTTAFLGYDPLVADAYGRIISLTLKLKI